MAEVPMTRDGKLDVHQLLYRNTEKLSFQDLLLLQQQDPDLYAENEDQINEYMEANGLSEDYERAQGVANGTIATNSDLIAALEADDIDFDTILAAGFDDLKDIENARPDLIVKLQTQLEAQGLYVTDESHKFYRDGKIGAESTSVTWNGIKLATEQGYDLAQDNIAVALKADANSENARLHLEQSMNRIRTEEGRAHLEVDGRGAEEVAQEIMQRFTENPALLNDAGRMAMRILDKNIDEGMMDALVAGNDNAAEVLDYVRNHQFHSGSFDYDAGTASAQTLLAFIGRYEANGRDVIYDGSPDGREVDLASKTINEWIDYQYNHTEVQGYASSALSPIQIIRTTLQATVDKIPELSGDEYMTPEVVERLGMELLDNRGLSRYLEGEMTTEAFIYNLSQEWASLPKDSGGRSYYAGDGLNAAHANYSDLANVLEDMRRNYHLELERNSKPQLLSSHESDSTLRTAWGNAGQEPEQPQIAAADATLNGQFAAAHDHNKDDEKPEDAPEHDGKDIAYNDTASKPIAPV